MPYIPPIPAPNFDWPTVLPQVPAAAGIANKPPAAPEPAAPRQSAMTASGAPGDEQPWAMRWREYLQSQAAHRQQVAQMMHGLGPYANQLTLDQVKQAVDAHRSAVMQFMLGAGPGAFSNPRPAR
jgi:hypothetical protein